MLDAREMREVSSRILYEDNHYICLNKRIGELVQGDETGDRALVDVLREYIAQRDGKPGLAFVQAAHRIDRPVSGAVLFAKTSKGLARMNELLRQRAVERSYWAITEAQLPEMEGELRGFASRNAELNKTFVRQRARSGDKEVVLSYRLMGASDRYFMYEVQLHTGRHHQIRAQLAEAGATIRGDLKYGAKRSIEGGGIDLHARRLRFVHPVAKKEVEIIAPPPPGPLWDLCLSVAQELR